MKRLLTIAELAERLSVARSWIYSHLETIPHIRFGRHLRFDCDALDFNEWLDQHRSHNYSPAQSKKDGPTKRDREATMVRRSYQKGRIQARQRKAGTIWVLRYRIKEGRKWTDKTEELRGCTSEDQARAAATARMRQVNQLNSADRPATTLNEFAAGLWKEYVKRIRPSTAYSYNSVLDLHILPALGDRSLVAISPADVTEFLKGRAGEGLVDKTLLNIYSLLALMFTCAVEYDLIDVSPVRRKLHRPRPTTAEKPVLNPDEIKRVIENIGAEYRSLFVCLALTGLRKGELFGLRWSDVDLSNRKLTIRNSLWRGELGTPKTKASNRVLWLPAALTAFLTEHLKRSRFTEPGDFVFCREDGSPLDGDLIRRDVLYPALAAAGIKRGKGTHGFHLFRHSAGTIVHAHTRDLKLAQRLLGHSRIGTTADIYTHVHDASEEATETLAREILGDVNFGAYAGPEVEEKVN